MSNPSIEDLDRCLHGRHSIDPCTGCPGGHSTGNLFLEPGVRIGTTLYGEPILAPIADRPIIAYVVDDKYYHPSDVAIIRKDNRDHSRTSVAPETGGETTQ